MLLRMKTRLIGLGLVSLLMAACGAPAQTGLAAIAPLDPAQPTFLYFYTDN
jgi:hypothetical protein